MIEIINKGIKMIENISKGCEMIKNISIRSNMIKNKLTWNSHLIHLKPSI